MAGDGGDRDIDDIEDEQARRAKRKDELILNKEEYSREDAQLLKQSNLLKVQVSALQHLINVKLICVNIFMSSLSRLRLLPSPFLRIHYLIYFSIFAFFL